MKVCTPTGCIGNRGINKEAFRACLDSENPDVIAVDAGSLDLGPWYLGKGLPHSPLTNIRWDLDVILSEAVLRKMPVIIGSAGGSGAKSNVDLTINVIKEVAKERNLDFRLGRIYADVGKDYLIQRIKKGDKIRKCPVSIFGEEALTPQDVEKCTNIVAMMGVEPLIEALKKGADVVIAGRAMDNGVIAAFPVMKGFDLALCIHMGDIMECAETALIDVEGVTRKSGPNRMPVIGEIERDYFLIKPGAPGMKATVTSVAGHSLYERESPFFSDICNGTIDRRECKFEQYDDLTVKVSGTKLIRKPYTVLLEGAGKVGYRSISILGIRNPVMISQIEEILAKCKEREEERFKDQGRFQIYYHIYGKNAVLDNWEPEKHISSYELGLVCETIAESQYLAHEVVDDLWLRIMFYRYEGRTTTAGNCAGLFSPLTIDMGEAYDSTIYHQMRLENPLELFPITIKNVKEL